MTSFLVEQVDYVYFVYGLAFILLAAVARALGWSPRSTLPWRWLAGFALVRGVSEWLDVGASSLPVQPTLVVASEVLFVAGSSALLLEFARRAARDRGRAVPAVTVLAVPLALSLTGLAGGWGGLSASVRLFVNLPAFLWAAGELWSAAGRSTAGGRSLRAASVGMALLGLATGVVVGASGSLPPPLSSPDEFLAATGLPIEYVRALFAFALAAGVAQHYRVLERPRRVAGKFWPRYDRELAITLVLALAGGWVFTEMTSASATAEERERAGLRAAAAASLLTEPVMASVAGGLTASQGPALGGVRAAIERLVASQPDVVSVAVFGVRHNRPYALLRVGDARGNPSGVSPELVEPILRLWGGSGASEASAGRRGTGLTGLARVLSSVTGEVLGVVALEFDAGHARSLRARERLGPILVTLFLALLLVAVYIGERRVGEAAARRQASDLRYRTLVDGAPNAVMLLEADGRLMAINRQGQDLLALPESQLVGRPLVDLWPASARDEVRAALERVGSGERAGFTAAYVVADGEQRTLEVALNPLPPDDYGAASAVGVAADVTDRQRARAALEHSHRLTQAILASSARFVGLRVEEVDEAIRAALREVASFLAVERAQLFRLSADRQSFSITHEWCAPGIPHRINELQQVGRDAFPWIWQTIERSGVAGAVDPSQLPAEAAPDREAILAQGVKSFICVAVHRHGQPVGFLALDVFSRRRAWPDDEVGLLRVVADVLSNALARKQAEEAIRESEQRFVKAFRNSPAPMMIFRARDDRTTEVNEAFLRVFGVRRDEVLGRTVGEAGIFARGEDLDTIREFLGRGLPLRDFEATLQTRAGEVRQAALAVDRFEAAGETFYLLVMADLTERKRAEEALREREEIFRSISAAAQDAIVMVDPAGRVTVWNDAAERMFGYTREEAEGCDVHEMLAPRRYEERAMAGLAQFGESGQGPIIGAPQQIVGRRKDGREVPVELSVSAIQLRGGWHAVAIIRDITERLKVDEALWKAKEETEAANLELQRAAEFANRLAEEAAVANASKSEFLANMSHEIRTPMNGIIGMTGLLLDTTLSEEQREYAETVRHCAESLLTIINDILDFSKMEAGRMDLEVLDFDLVVTLEEMTDILAVRAHQKGLEVTCLVAPEVPTALCGDPGRLRQVLTNLIGNAIKFTEAGEVGLQVLLEEETAEQATLRFLVRDTGIGIPADKIESLFQPFTQVDNSTTRRFGGTGLGLSISRQLVALMGGEVGVESEPGQGSTFHFTARFGKQRQPAAAPPPIGEIEGLRVLGVDDNATNRKVLSCILAGWGCRCEIAADGESALARLREAAAAGDPFRIALLDMAMPAMRGDELGRRIKDDRAISPTQLVMMTSVGRRGDVSQLAELGFSGYLTKPIKSTQLRDTLRTLAGRVQAGRSPDSRPLVTRFTLAEAARRRVRILLAEDNITNQRVARAMLEKMGHRVDAVANGAEALRALGTMPYDLVLMDVQMPEMDGFEATRAIRSAGTAVRNPGVPIIAMTAHAMKGDRERCLAAGMDDYVSKPIRPEELSAAIARWAPAEAVEPARAPAPPPGPDAQKPAPPRGPAVDRAALLDRLAGDDAILDEIVKVFLEDAPRQLQAMEAARASADAGTLRRLAHSLKGSAGTVGATALQQAALDLERAIDGGQTDGVPGLLRTLAEQFALVQSEMSAWLAGKERT